jgi:hypothetical protein
MCSDALDELRPSEEKAAHSRFGTSFSSSAMINNVRMEVCVSLRCKTTCLRTTLYEMYGSTVLVRNIQNVASRHSAFR